MAQFYLGVGEDKICPKCKSLDIYWTNDEDYTYDDFGNDDDILEDE